MSVANIERNKEKLYQRYFGILVHLLSKGDADKFASIFKRALKDGYPIDYTPEDHSYHLGSTLLHYSVDWCGISPVENAPSVQLVLDAGADIAKKDILGRTPLVYACFYGKWCVPTAIFEQLIVPEQLNQKYLINRNGKEITPFSGIANGYIIEKEHTGGGEYTLPKLKQLLEAGADSELLRDQWDWTPAELAEYKHPEGIKQSIAEIKKLIAIYQEQKYQLNNSAEVYYDYEI